jgi:putative flippase GtrA
MSAIERVSALWREELVKRGLRFLLTGVLVGLIYLAVTSLLAVVIGLPFQLALVLGSLVAVSVHFTLQRVFVWVHPDGFALALHRQLGWYLPMAGAQYAANALSTLLLPRLLGIPAEAVFLIVAPLIALGNFLLYRDRIFHPHSAQRDVM